MLLRLEQSDCQRRKLYVNWEVGTTSETLTPIVAIRFGRGQGVPRTQLGLGPVVHTRTTITQTWETHVSKVQCLQVMKAESRPQGVSVTVPATERSALKEAEELQWIQKWKSSNSSSEEEAGNIDVGSP